MVEDLPAGLVNTVAESDEWTRIKREEQQQVENNDQGKEGEATMRRGEIWFTAPGSTLGTEKMSELSRGYTPAPEKP